MSEDLLGWINDKKTFAANVEYRDTTPTPDLTIQSSDDIVNKAKDNAAQLSNKMYGKDVRKSLAQWVLLGGYIYSQGAITLEQFQAALNSFEAVMQKRQNKVESDQKDLANQFAQAVGALTADSEVVLSRDSKNFGGFGLLDGRLEFIEDMIAHQVPGGFEIEIQHNQGEHPSCQVDYYEYAIGSEPDGFGSGPNGTFGGINYKNVNCGVDYIDNSRIKIKLPVAFSLPNAKFSYADQYWYIYDGYKTIRVYLGGVDGAKATSGLTLSIVRSTITDSSTNAVSAKVANGEITWTDGGGTSAT